MVLRQRRSAARRECFGRVQICSGAKRPGRKAASLIFYLPTFVLRRGVASSEALTPCVRPRYKTPVEPSRLETQGGLPCSCSRPHSAAPSPSSYGSSFAVPLARPASSGRWRTPCRACSRPAPMRSSVERSASTSSSRRSTTTRVGCSGSGRGCCRTTRSPSWRRSTTPTTSCGAIKASTSKRSSGTSRWTDRSFPPPSAPSRKKRSRTASRSSSGSPACRPTSTRAAATSRSSSAAPGSRCCSGAFT